MKAFAKLRKLGSKGKAMVCAAFATVAMAFTTVVASAAESTPETAVPNFKTILSDAGDQLMVSFNDLVQTMIPIILGILGSGLVIFGLFALIKLAKKVFGKVAS